MAKCVFIIQNEPFFLKIPLLCFSPRSMKTPAWSQLAYRAELTALTQPTCQPRDSSSSQHLGYSGVLFTMQHSVQHKKIRSERTRESESVRNSIYIVLGSWDPWLHLI